MPQMKHAKILPQPQAGPAFRRHRKPMSAPPAIQQVLDDRLPRTYKPELYEQKCGVLYQHVFDSYQGLGKGLYAN
jgi:type I restriction enzyme R subunit